LRLAPSPTERMNPSSTRARGRPSSAQRRSRLAGQRVAQATTRPSQAFAAATAASVSMVWIGGPAGPCANTSRAGRFQPEMPT